MGVHVTVDDESTITLRTPCRTHWFRSLITRCLRGDLYKRVKTFICIDPRSLELVPVFIKPVFTKFVVQISISLIEILTFLNDLRIFYLLPDKTFELGRLKRHKIAFCPYNFFLNQFEVWMKIASHFVKHNTTNIKKQLMQVVHFFYRIRTRVSTGKWTRNTCGGELV
jgi:hypothetical protein